MVYTGTLDDYELLVWNGVSDATCSPVQDVDVYANNVLVWTGELSDDCNSSALDSTVQPGGGKPAAAGMRNREYTSRLLLTGRGGTRPPSNVIPLSVEPAVCKREATACDVTPMAKPQHTHKGAGEAVTQDFKGDYSTTGPSEMHPERSGSGSVSASYCRKDTDGATSEKLQETSRCGDSRSGGGNAPTEPVWMTDFKTTPRDGPLSARLDSDINFVEPSRLHPTVIAPGTKAVASKKPTSPDKSLDLYFLGDKDTMGGDPPGSRRRGSRDRGEVQRAGPDVNEGERKPFSRGSRRKAQQEPQDAQGSVPAMTTPSPPVKARKSRREAKKEEEERLRQSMDALSASDRRNRGRLEQELTIAGGGRHETVEGGKRRAMPQIGEAEEADQAVDIDVSPLSLEATVAVNLTTRRMKALEELAVGGELDRELLGEAVNRGDQRMVLRQRSQRIGQVQEKVSNALASLAGVMSTMPGQSKGPPEHTTLKLTPSNLDPSTSPDGGKVMGRGTDQAILSIPDTAPKDVAEVDVLQASLEGGIDDLLAESYLEGSMCEIPVLPKGRILEIEVLSTWGDPYYVGLNGIDVFDHHGEILLHHEGIESIQAHPSDINILPEYHDDPRTIYNVLDGQNFTRDDLHVWLAPHGHTLTPRLPYAANITISFSKFTTVSVIRIWNYNKSRTHCYRGVRRCRIKLDNRTVFEGEIRAAPGLATSTEDCSEVILFTTDSVVLGKVAAYDATMGYLGEDMTEEQSSGKWLEQVRGQKAHSRPRTADRASRGDGGDSTVLTRRKQAASKPEGLFEPSQSRPVTAAIRPTESRYKPIATEQPMSAEIKSIPATTAITEPTQLETYKEPLSAAEHSDFGVLKKRDLVECRVLTFVIERTWGDKCYVGLAGLEVLIGQSCIATDIDANMVDAEPRDLSAIGCFDDPRTPDKLVDGVNNTTDDTHMWLIPYTPGSTHEVKIDLGAICAVAGFNVWNYNKSPEDALRGARVLAVHADGRLLGRCEIRMAPGCDGVDSKQCVLLRDIAENALSTKSQGGLRYVTPAVRQDYETPVLPSGTTWRFNLHCNWGDGYYIGLDGLQLLDERGNEILLESTHCRLDATPHSLCELGVADSRLPRNLAYEPRSDPTGCMAWLAPLAQCMTTEERRNSLRYTVGRAVERDFEPLFYEQNVLYVFFDYPVTVSVAR